MFRNKRSLPPIEALAAYKNDRVILNFLKKYSMERTQAEEVFKETLKWLWLCRSHDRREKVTQDTPETLSIYYPMRLVDEMWHSFILCTLDYQEFCEKYLGGFIHHEPNVEPPDALRALPRRNENQNLEREQTVRYICRKLGPETIRKWFVEYDAWTGELNAAR